MFTWLRGVFSRDLLIELSESCLSVQSFSGGGSFECEPVMALETSDEGLTIVAIGQEAHQYQGPQYRKVNPFSHPRSFVGDVRLAEKVLQHAVSKLHSKGFRAAPRVVVHQLMKTEDGLTDIEVRVLRELALGAGAREVVIHLGGRIDPKMRRFNDVKEEGR